MYACVYVTTRAKANINREAQTHATRERPLGVQHRIHDGGLPITVLRSGLSRWQLCSTGELEKTAATCHGRSSSCPPITTETIIELTHRIRCRVLIGPTAGDDAVEKLASERLARR